MSVIRNSVEIHGLTLENEIPESENGQTIEFSEMDYLQIPLNKIGLDILKEVYLELEMSQGRTINMSDRRIIIIDGVKKINIKYFPNSRYERMIDLKFELPFNTFIDIPKDAGNIRAIDAFLMDAYFQAIDSRKIYYHILYMINAKYSTLK